MANSSDILSDFKKWIGRAERPSWARANHSAARGGLRQTHPTQPFVAAPRM